jgi:hypothetical protein
MPDAHRGVGEVPHPPGDGQRVDALFQFGILLGRRAEILVGRQHLDEWQKVERSLILPVR